MDFSKCPWGEVAYYEGWGYRGVAWMEMGRVGIEGNKWNGNDIGLIVVVSGRVMIGLVPNNGPNSSNKYNMEVVTTSILEIVIIEWTMDSTSMSISIPNSVPQSIVSKMVVDMDDVCNDELWKLGDATVVDGGIYSTMGKAIGIGFL